MLNVTEPTESSGAQRPVFELTTSPQFAGWLHGQRASLAFTTYQTAKLFLVGMQPNGRLSIFERTLERVMGMHPANRFTGNTPGFVFTSIGFEGAEAVDDLRVQINLSERNPIAFGLLTEVHIHCKDAYERMSLDEAASNPIGSGPYRLASWTRGSEVVLEKVGEPANFQRIVWRIIPEASTRTAELIAGNVDVVMNVLPEQIEAIDGSGRAQVDAVSGTRRMYVGFNLSEEHAAAARRRRRSRIPTFAGRSSTRSTCLRSAASSSNVECERATGLVNTARTRTPNLEPYPYDPDTAERLLDEAGWPRGADGTRFSIRMQAGQGRYVNDVNVVLAIVQYLEDVGLDVDLELMEWASVYTPLLRERRMGPLFFLGTGGGLWSPIYDMTDIASGRSPGTNYVRTGVTIAGGSAGGRPS